MLLSDFFKIILSYNNAITPLELQQFSPELQNDFHHLIKDLENFIESNQLTNRIFNDTQAELLPMEKNWLQSYLNKREEAIRKILFQANKSHEGFFSPSDFLCRDLAKTLNLEKKSKPNELKVSEPAAIQIDKPLKWHEFGEKNSTSKQANDNKRNLEISNAKPLPSFSKKRKINPYSVETPIKISNSTNDLSYENFNHLDLTTDEDLPNQISISPELIEEAHQFSFKQIENLYLKAKSELKNIKITYKKESNNFSYDNSYFFNAENKAINSLNRIKELYEEVIAYFFDENSPDSSLLAVKISLEFINEYPIKEEIFKNEIAKLQKCSIVCQSIINNNDQNLSYLNAEARAWNDAINNFYIPATYYNFAVFSFKKLNFKISNNPKIDTLKDIEILINTISNNIENLKKAQEYCKNFKLNSEYFTIDELLSKSYEYIADFQFKLADFKLDQNDKSESLINLYNQIKTNYLRSLTYFNNIQVGLSVLYCQQKLIKIYTDNKNLDKALLEISVLMQFAKNELSLLKDENPSFKSELISYILYAYSQAFSLTSSQDYQQKALNFLLYNKEFLVKNAANYSGDFQEEIIRSLIDLNIISEHGEWDLQSAIKAATANISNIRPGFSGHEFFQRNIITIQSQENWSSLLESSLGALNQPK